MDDLTCLPEITRDSILKALEKRFESSQVYTFAGDSLISINPYRSLGDGNVDSFSALDNRPHVFAVAARALRQSRHRPQAILCSGESGAGKTENTRRILKFIGQQSSTANIQQQIADANPVLEALGNAKTVRNNNSSRFGKLVSARMRDGLFIGASIETYLLERSRVTHVATGEGNFHIFRQIAGSAAKFRMLGHEDFCPGTWEETAKGLRTFGMDPTLVKRVVEGILFLSEINFKSDGKDGSVIDGQANLEKSAALLGLEVNALSNGLLFAELDVRKGGTQLMKRLSPAKASEQRNALARLIYVRLFDWVVQEVNRTLASENGDTSIFILDIFGFEAFEENLHEQLLINLANEQLHQLFVDATMRSEQERYKREGVNVDYVDFSESDNTQVVKSIQSLLRSLDDATQLGKPFTPEKHPRISLPKRGAGTFTVEHFAGQVTYNPSGMALANVDAVDVGLLALCSSSKLMSPLFAEQPSLTSAKSRKASISKQFQESMKRLLAQLSQAELSFIKCIKPNHEQQSHFTANAVETQVLQSGIFEVVKLRACGFEIHLSAAEFQAQFGLLQLNVASEGPDIVKGKTMYFMRKTKRAELEKRLERYIRAAAVIQRSWRIVKRNAGLKRIVRACIAVVTRTEEQRRKAREEAERRAREAAEAEAARQRQLKQEEEERKQKEKQKVVAPVLSVPDVAEQEVVAADLSPLPSPVPPKSPSRTSTGRRFSFRSSSSSSIGPPTPTMSRQSRSSSIVTGLDPEAQKLASEMGIVDVPDDQRPILDAVLERALRPGGAAVEGKYHFTPVPTLDEWQTMTDSGMNKLKGKEVYRGRSASVFVKDQIALKVVSRSDDSAPRELAVLKRLQSMQHVVNLTAAFVTPQHVYFQMSAVNGATLSAVARHTSFEALHVSFIMRQVLAGLKIIHGAGVVHRSISMSHIMITQAAQVTIIDFGSSSFVPPEEKLTGMTGAPFFVSPEMVRGERHDFKTDIYSVGCVAYTMATGHLPTLKPGQKSSRALGLRCMFLVGTSRVPLLDGLKNSTSVVEFCNATMIADPDERPTAAQLLETHPFLQQQMLTVDLKKAVAKAAKEKVMKK